MSDSDLPARLGDLLDPAGSRLGLPGASEMARIWNRWGEIVGEDVALHAEPTSLRDGVLRVRADTPVWATEIGYLAEEIRRRVNDVTGTQVVRDIRIWTGPGPTRGRSSNARPASPPASLRGSRPDEVVDPMEALQRARRAWEKRRRKDAP